MKESNMKKKIKESSVAVTEEAIAKVIPLNPW